MSDLKDFVGAWTFDAAASDYGEAPVPEGAIYTMVPDAGGLACEVRWAAGGERHVASYHCAPDGEEHALEDAPGATLRSRWEGAALVTEVLTDGEVRGRATRKVEGDDLTIVQENLTEDVHTTGLYRRSRVKQVMLYRRDLKMRKGKIAAQVAHASMKVFFALDRGGGQSLSIPLPGPMAVWTRASFAKVVLSVESEEDLVAAYDAARSADLPAALITDSGRTEFGGVPTRTTVAIGPWTSGPIDAITGPDGVVPTKLA